jgi:hypothetical protein
MFRDEGRRRGAGKDLVDRTHAAVARLELERILRRAFQLLRCAYQRVPPEDPGTHTTGKQRPDHVWTGCSGRTDHQLTLVELLRRDPDPAAATGQSVRRRRPRVPRGTFDGRGDARPAVPASPFPRVSLDQTRSHSGPFVAHSG